MCVLVDLQKCSLMSTLTPLVTLWELLRNLMRQLVFSMTMVSTSACYLYIAWPSILNHCLICICPPLSPPLLPSSPSIPPSTPFLLPAIPPPSGILLHYEDNQLSDLYFIDPQWLCTMLAKVITIQEKNPYQKNGTHPSILFSV